MSGVKKNIFYNSILTISNYIFPLITYPYVSRVLGVTNIGMCNFVDSIINYYVMFSMMGISYIGIREIASSNEQGELSKKFSSLVVINAITTFIALIALIICTEFVPIFNEHKQLYYIGIIKLLGSFLSIEWLYKGIEQFKYITNRTIIVKTLYVVSVFLFIRTVDDYKTYYLLLSLMIGVNALINVIHSRKYVKFTIKGLNLSILVKPFLIMGIYIFLTSMYQSFNVAYLGFAKDNTEVGYYTTAMKLFQIVLSIYTAFTAVMMPRMSSLVATEQIDEFNSLIKKSINVLLTVSIPLSIFFICFSSEVIRFIAGPGYDGAVVPFALISLIVTLCAFDQVQVIQVLMPLKEDKAVFINSLVAAVISIVLNIVLVPKYGAVASAIVLICCELTVLIVAQIQIKHSNRIDLSFPLRSMLVEVTGYIPMIVGLILLHRFYGDNYLITLTIGAIISFAYFLVLQVFIRHNVFVENIYNRLLKIIKNESD